MIFIMKPDGTIMPSIPSPVYQGADGTNVIYLFAPSMVGNEATVAFRTPDGVWTEREPMTLVANLPEEFAKYKYCVWQYTIGSPIARLDGVVTVQFFFYANGAILPSSASSFVVGKGVPVILPTSPSQGVYNQILQAISAIQKSQQYGDYAARAIFEWREERVDGAAISYGIGEFTYVPAGAEGGPKGKTGSFIKSLVAENTQPPYVEGKLNSEYWEEVVNFDYLNELYFTSLKDLVTEAEGYKDTAETAKDEAISAKEAAEAAQTGAVTAREAAETAETNARESAQSASASEGNAANSERNAAAYEQGAEAARDIAIEARNAAELAAGQAASAVKDDLKVLKDAAQAAAQNAQKAEQGAVDAKNAANVVLADTTREKEAAEAAKDEAISAKTGAETALAGALTAKEATETAERETLAAKEEAQAAESGAQEARRGAETANEQAQAAAEGAAEKATNAVVEELQGLKDDAQAAEENAQKAAQGAQTAQQGAEAAKDRAVQAQDALENAGSAINTRLSAIEEKIPPQASAADQLAPRSFVNSTVQTATANFRGNWTAWDAVPTTADEYPEDYAGSKTPTVNDYIVVQDASAYTKKELKGTWRFKYSGTWETNGIEGWQPEYQVNETPLTAAQLEALNSGLSKESLAQIEANTKAIAAEKERATAAEQKNASAVEAAQKTADSAIPKTEKGAKNGVATLGEDGKVPSAQLPNAIPPAGAAGGDLTGNFPNPAIAGGAVTKEKCGEDVKASLERADAAVPAATKGQAGGVASLGTDGKVPTSQLPASATGDYIPSDEKGEPNGVATLDDDGKVPSGQLPNAIPPTGTAGGDLKGSYPNPELKTGAVTREKCSSEVQDSLNNADNAMPQKGGTFTGPVNFNSDSLPQDENANYFVVVDNYKMGYSSPETVKEKLGINEANKNIAALQKTVTEHEKKIDAAANLATAATNTAEAAAAAAAAAMNTAKEGVEAAAAAQEKAETADQHATAAAGIASSAIDAVNDLATVAKTGKYSDLLGKPTIPSALDAYPVGSVYMSEKTTSPASLFGGNWSAWGSNLAVVSATEAKTGTSCSPSLPRITGNFSVYNGWESSQISSAGSTGSAIYLSKGMTSRYHHSGLNDSNAYTTVNIDASRASSVYANGTNQVIPTGHYVRIWTRTS